jgi:integrase
MARQRRVNGSIDRLPSGRYRVRVVRPDGSRVSIGTFATKRDADAAFATVLTGQADGRQPGSRTAVKLDGYASDWLDSRLTARGEPLRPRVRELYEGQLRLHIVPALGDVPLHRLTTARIRSWHAALRGPDGPGASSAAKCYRLLRSILATAVEDGLLAANPCTIKGAGIEPAEERRVPTVAEAYKLADAIEPRLRCLVLVAGSVGLRKGELLGLRRGDIDLDARTITVARQRQLDKVGNELVGPPKSDAGRRTVSISPKLVPVLRRHLDTYAQPGDDGYVFTGQKGGPLMPHVLQTAWVRARSQVGMEHLHLHDLRHLAGTLAASKGAAPKEIMHRLGHSSAQASLRYQHATHVRDGAIADAIDEDLQEET